MVNINEVYTSKYLTAADLNDMEHTVTITAENAAKFKNDQGQEEVKITINVTGFQKAVTINKTNAQIIASKYGPETEGWVGKTIILYPAMVPFGNKVVPAIRVRIPLQQAPASQDHQAPANHDALQRAQAWADGFLAKVRATTIPEAAQSFLDDERATLDRLKAQHQFVHDSLMGSVQQHMESLSVEAF